MLYDPKWEQKAKADPFTIEGLIAWLEKQPADKVYCYTQNGDCLLARYLKSSGWEEPWVGGYTAHDKAGRSGAVSDCLDCVSYGVPRTYGGALERARALHK